MIIENVLTAGIFDAIQNTARISHYEPIVREDETSIYVSDCPNFFEKKINIVLEGEIGEFSTITSYFRKNTPEIDSHFRVHSDRDILGENPTHGVVYYLDIESGGTGFYNHKTYGESLPIETDQPESEYGDESLWTFREHIEGKPNRMIAYPASVFHMRHPVKSVSDRIVWVSFIKVKGYYDYN